jgi:hypothetical protein
LVQNLELSTSFYNEHSSHSSVPSNRLNSLKVTFMQLVEGLMPQKSRRSPPLALKRGGRSVGFLAKLPFAAPKSQRALFSDKNRESSLIAKPFWLSKEMVLSWIWFVHSTFNATKSRLTMAALNWVCSVIPKLQYIR